MKVRIALRHIVIVTLKSTVNMLQLPGRRVYTTSDYLQLQVKSSSLKKSGGWNRTLHDENLDSYLIKQPYVDDQDVQIISAVIRNQHYSNAIKLHKA